MAPVKGHAAPIAISAVIVGTTTVIIRICAVIDRAAIAVVGRAALGCGDRKAGPDNTGKSCGCGGATAAPIEPAAGAEVGGVAWRGRRRQALARWGGPGGRPPPPFPRQRPRPNWCHHRNAALGRKHT